MFKVKLARGNESINVPFREPILDWREASARFFDLIYRSLTPRYMVTVADLSANGGPKLSDAWAKYQLRGAPSSITLFSDRLYFDFVNLLDSDYLIMYDIIGHVHDKFPNVFPQLDYDRIETQSATHFELAHPAKVDDYLNLFEAKNSLSAFASFGNFVDERIARFGVMAADQSWRCRFGVDRSLSLPNGVFIDMTLTLRYKEKNGTFTETLLLAQRISEACRTTLMLEASDV